MTSRQDWPKPDLLQQRRLELGLPLEPAPVPPLFSLVLKGGIAPDGICEQSFRFRPTRGLEGFHPGVMKPRIAPRADCNSCHSLPVGLFKGFGVEEGSAEISLSQISSIKTATCEVRSA
jgi:hypothetical protein